MGMFFNGRNNLGMNFYFVGMDYGNCKEQSHGCSNQTQGACGFRLDHNITLYSSKSLASGSWAYRGNLLPPKIRPSGTYYRPKVIYNAHTQKWVLWVNYLPEGKSFLASSYLAATSSNLAGPYTVQSEHIKTKYTLGGDFDIFVEDNVAYLIYTSLEKNHQISIERLTPDYLASTFATSGLFGKSPSEAPAMFKRNGVYFALFGHTCCFCEEGSGVGVYTSHAPLGPYEYHGDVGRYANDSTITHAQQNCVLRVPNNQADPLEIGADPYYWIWIGNRWQSAPDHLKDHDFEYWYPMQFTDDKTIETFKWIDSFKLDIATVL
eukprot:TRINITY_DN4502_c0_g1_i1.p1 TRINITY_DN4502_c0_g1~~TRINITY_DN4502_c0_g1_i1.p1  ORF type:complete len:321 (-),score=22.84 TRINITY_DN4502_c0_g1_i1:40-1002(-)